MTTVQDYSSILFHVVCGYQHCWWAPSLFPLLVTSLERYHLPFLRGLYKTSDQQWCLRRKKQRTLCVSSKLISWLLTAALVNLAIVLPEQQKCSNSWLTRSQFTRKVCLVLNADMIEENAVGNIAMKVTKFLIKPNNHIWISYSSLHRPLIRHQKKWEDRSSRNGERYWLLCFKFSASFTNWIDSCSLLIYHEFDDSSIVFIGPWIQGQRDSWQGSKGQRVRVEESKLLQHWLLRIRYHRAHWSGFEVRSLNRYLRHGLLYCPYQTWI